MGTVTGISPMMYTRVTGLDDNDIEVHHGEMITLNVSLPVIRKPGMYS